MKMFHITCILLVLLLSGSCSDYERGVAPDGHPVVGRLNRIVIPKVVLTNATVEEAFDYLRQLSMVHDKEPDPARGGISMIVCRPMHTDDHAGDKKVGLDASDRVSSEKITYTAENVAYLDLVAELARQAHMDAYLTSIGIMVIPEGQAPFPNSKSEKGEIWMTLRKSVPLK